MLVYEDCRHEESAPQVRAMELAFKKSSEGQRLNKLIREKNVDGFLPRSFGEYMNAAEDLASEPEAALQKARKYTDAAGGKPSAPGTGTKRMQRRQQASSYKQSAQGAAFLIMSTKSVFTGTTLILIRTLRLSMRNRYIKELDMDPTMHKNDRGGCKHAAKTVTSGGFCRAFG